MNAIVQQAQMTVNQQGLIGTLKKAFENKQAVIKETAQNARRAGATEVRIYYCKIRNFYAVVDNGNGIDDINTLIAVAESGWDAQTKQKETPYGMGMLSGLYVANEIFVSSKGKCFRASTESILSMIPFDVHAGYSGNRTVIAFYGGEVDSLFDANFNSIFKGFPIDVYVNDVKLSRINAVNGPKKFVANEHGVFFLSPGSHPSEPIEFYSKLILYYQGFEIGHSQYVSEYQASICHVDQELYPAIAPDRHKLINADVAIKVLEEQLIELIRNEIRLISESDSAHLLLDSVETLREYNMLHVLNSLDSIPRKCLLGLKSIPILSSNFEGEGEELSHPENHILRASIEAGHTVIFDDVYNPDEEDNWDDCPNFAAAYYCYSKDLHWIDYNRLDSGHWIFNHIKSPSSVEVILNNGRVTQSSQYSNGLNNCHVVLCDSYKLNGPFGSIDLNNIGLRIKSSDIMPGDQILVPNGEESGYHIILQDSSFVDEWGGYLDDDRDDNVRAFETWLTNERLSNAPEKIILGAITDLPSKFPSLKGKSYTITIDEDGTTAIQVN